jgi:hypothetical protein
MAEGRFSMIHAPEEQNKPNAVLVVTNERVFTEEEVKAMLKDTFRGYDRTGEGVTWERMKAVALEHGIAFDPT